MSSSVARSVMMMIGIVCPAFRRPLTPLTPLHRGQQDVDQREVEPTGAPRTEPIMAISRALDDESRLAQDAFRPRSDHQLIFDEKYSHRRQSKRNLTES